MGLICLPELVNLVKSATGWPVYPMTLPESATYGVVYEVAEDAEPAQGEVDASGMVEVTLFIFHDHLGECLAKAREVEHALKNAGGVVSCADGRLAGGQVVSREVGREPGDGLYFAMMRLALYSEMEV